MPWSAGGWKHGFQSAGQQSKGSSSKTICQIFEEVFGRCPLGRLALSIDLSHWFL